MDVHQRIRRKLLKIVQDQGGCWSEQDIESIDSGAITLETYLKELVQEGHLYYDRAARSYILTDVGGRHLDSLMNMEAPDS